MTFLHRYRASLLWLVAVGYAAYVWQIVETVAR